MFSKLKSIRSRSGTQVEADTEEQASKPETKPTNDGSVIQAASMWDIVAEQSNEAPTPVPAEEQSAVEPAVEAPLGQAAEAQPDSIATKSDDDSIVKSDPVVAEPTETVAEDVQAPEATPAENVVAPLATQEPNDVATPDRPNTEVASVEETAPSDPSSVAEVVSPVAVPTPIPARAAPEAKKEAETAPEAAKPRRSGRVKTRLLGFDRSNGESVDIADMSKKQAELERIQPRFPVGWLVVVAGPGIGECFNLSAGVSQIGREEGQAVQLDFGDTTISRANHASIAFDDEQRHFYIGHGGKSNLVRLNGKPLLSTEQIKSGDEIKIGETTLRLAAFCGEDFTWDNKTEEQ